MTFDSLISFGSNLGRRHDFLTAAMELLWEIKGLENLVASDPIVTKAVGGPENQPNFLNAVFRATTNLSANELHQQLIEIEDQLGRERRTRWGSRKIDLDLLLHGAVELLKPDLVVPHPRMSFRRFVLKPAMEIAGDMVHPLSGCTVAELFEKISSENRRIVIAGTAGGKAEWLSLMKDLRFGNSDAVKYSLEQFVEVKHPDDLVPLESQSALLVFDTTEFDSELHEVLIRFPGPTLNLTGKSETEKSKEIQAAVAALD